MNYFLVKGRVHERPYMGDERTYEETRLVKADDEEDAKYKFEMYWENKSSEYSVSYYCYAQALETIE